MTMRVTLRLMGLLLLGPALLAVACGGSTDDDDDEAPTFIDEPTFRQSFPTRVCALIASCCSRISVPISEAAGLVEAQDLVDELSLNGTAYDGAAAAACLNGYSEPLARCALPTDYGVRSCGDVYSGTVPAGGACQNDGDCAGDAYCLPDATGVFSCVTADFSGLPAAVEGEACAGSCSGDGTEPCGAVALPGSPPKVCYATDGLVCDVSGVCVPLPGIGQPCDSFCALGAYCDFELARCVATLPDGELCESPMQCQSRQCGAGRCGGFEMIDAALCAEF